MKRTKKIALIMLAVALMAVCFIFGASAERAVVISGDCGAEGDNVTYVLYDDGELVISGTGAMADYGESFGGGSSWSSGEIPWYDYDVVSIKVNEGVTRIGNAAFIQDNDKESLLQRIELPDSLVEIGEIAFSDCSALVDIVLPDNLVSIGAGAFQYCYSLKEIVIPDSVSIIETNTFDMCSRIEKIILGKGVKAIKTNAFYNNRALQTVEYKGLKEDLADILIYSGNDIFVEVLIGKAIEEITIDGLVYEIIGNNAVVTGHTSDISENLVIPAYVQDCPVVVVEPRAFQSTKITSLVLPDTVVEINYYAFAQCVELKDISFGKGLLKIGDTAFSDCKALESIEFPEKLKIIDDQAFVSCGNLKSVIIPESVTTIGDYAFSDCVKLKNIFIPASVTYISYSAFSEAISLESIIVDENNAAYSSDENGVLFDKDKTKLILYPRSSKTTEYVVPSTVETICEGSFENVIYLKKIEFPESLKEFEEYSLSLDFGLTEIIIPEGVEKICDFAIVLNPFIDRIVVESMDVELGGYSINPTQFEFFDITQEEIIELYKKILLDGDEEAMAKISEHILYTENIIHLSTIYCHSGSTAEAYAIENGVKYELTHFFEGEWTYDYDNMIRTRKCIHCDELETEPLESTENGDVEIIEPVDPDTDFEVDEIKGDKFLVVEETVVNGIEGNAEVLRAFDITLKNKDGVHVQPDGTVKVKLPLNWTKDGIYKVYRVNDDGTLTDMNAYRQGSHMVFETDHFSIYVIVDVSEKSEADEPETPDVPTEPDTSDCNCICHAKDIIKRFIAIIYKFVIELLGIEHICECGVAHY